MVRRLVYAIVQPLLDQPQPRRRLSQKEKLQNALVTIAQLERDIARLNDRLRRLKEEVEAEAILWETILETGQGETYDAVKRRISRLRGALQYPGIVG